MSILLSKVNMPLIHKMVLDFFTVVYDDTLCPFVTLFDFSDLYYFLLAPTLCYQRDFPCTPKVRVNKLFPRLLEMVS